MHPVYFEMVTSLHELFGCIQVSIHDRVKCGETMVGSVGLVKPGAWAGDEEPDRETNKAAWRRFQHADALRFKAKMLLRAAKGRKP